MVRNIWRHCVDRLSPPSRQGDKIKRKQKPNQLSVESLEQRAVPANLSVSSISLVKGDGTALTSAAVGQLVSVKVNFVQSQFATPAPFIAKVSIGGVDHFANPVAGVVAGNVGTFTVSGLLVKSGTQTIKVKLDELKTVPESNESDNSKSMSFVPVTFKSTYTTETKFSTPLAGTPNVHWYINNYVDLDRSEDDKLDYTGHTGDAETYDNHNGLDIGTVGGISETQYVGLPVLAAAGGIVTEAEDGKFDENTAWADGLGGGNQVTIRHGNGWVTNYYHMRKGSISVNVGDYVSAGDVIGMMASSGNSTGTHLHFEVSFNGAVVETYVAPAKYWVSPLPYAKDVGVSIETYTKYHTTESSGVAKVKIHRDLLESDTWTYTTQAMSAKPGSDYEPAIGETVHFDAAQTSKWIYIPIIDDDIHEGAQKFRINFKEVGGAGGPGTYSQDWTIIDDDHLVNFDNVNDSPTKGQIVVNGQTEMLDDVVTLDVQGTNLVVIVNNETETFPLNGWHGPVTSIIVNTGDGNDLITVLKRPAGVGMTINGGDDTDTLNLNSTQAGTGVTLNGGSGDDYFNVGKPSPNYLEMSLNGFLGDMTVNGGSGENTLNVRGNSAADPGRNYTIAGAGLSWGVAQVLYSNLSHLNLSTGKGKDTIDAAIGDLTNKVVIDAGAGTDTLIGPSGLGNFWNINAKNAGAINLNAITFKNAENLTGGSNDDLFKFSSGASITGSLKGGGGIDAVSYSSFSSFVEVNLQTSKGSAVSGTIKEIEKFTGGSSGTDRFIAANKPNTWFIFEDNAFTLNGFDHIAYGFENLRGANNDSDTFKFNDGAEISGLIEGQGGTDTLDYSNFGEDVIVDMSTKTATATGGFSSIESMIGGTGSDTLAGNGVAAGINLWSVTAQNKGTFAGPSTNVAFDGVENLKGYSNTDWFVFDNGAKMTGKVDGQGGSDTLNFSSYTTPVTVNLAEKSSTATGAFASIEYLVGGSATDKLVGSDFTNSWKITSKNAGKVGASLNFSSFESLQGGDVSDTYTFSNGASLDGSISDDGRSGSNTLDYTAYTTPVSVNLATGQATGVVGGIQNIDNVTGGSAGDTLIGDQGTNILRGNAGADSLDGGDGADILLGGAQNDTLTGGGSRDLLFGGLGSDNLDGGIGEDVLFGSTVSQENNTIALLALLTEWNRLDLDYSQRVTSLKNVGVGAAFNKLDAGTIADDVAKDSLTGGLNADWFWALGANSTLDLTDADGTEQVN